MGVNVSVPHAQGALVRVLPPPVFAGGHKDSGANPITLPDGRTWSCAIGSSINVPAHDAERMVGNGWTQFAESMGTTAQRPSGVNVTRGYLYLDTTVGHVIVYDGATWRDKDGSAA